MFLPQTKKIDGDKRFVFLKYDKDWMPYLEYPDFMITLYKQMFKFVILTVYSQQYKSMIFFKLF